jgi:hypothetical protein
VKLRAQHKIQYDICSFLRELPPQSCDDWHLERERSVNHREEGHGEEKGKHLWGEEEMSAWISTVSRRIARLVISSEYSGESEGRNEER